MKKSFFCRWAVAAGFVADCVAGFAAPPTNDQRGYYKGNATTTITYFDRAKSVKVKNSAIVDLGSDGIYIYVPGADGGYLSGSGSGNYGAYNGVYVGPNGLNARLSFKGTGNKVTLTMKGSYTSLNAGTPYTAEFSAKLKKNPD